MASRFTSDLGSFTARLFQINDRISRAVRDVLEQEAIGILDKARQMVPREFGAMESAINLASANTRRKWIIHVDEGVPRDPRKGTAGTVGDYLMLMHEGFYRLGPASQAKQAASRFRVGPRFMERALLAQLRSGTMRRIEAAARRALRS